MQRIFEQNDEIVKKITGKIVQKIKDDNQRYEFNRNRSNDIYCNAGNL